MILFSNHLLSPFPPQLVQIWYFIYSPDLPTGYTVLSLQRRQPGTDKFCLLHSLPLSWNILNFLTYNPKGSILWTSFRALQLIQVMCRKRSSLFENSTVLKTGALV